jgi:hypothetical protein
MLDVSFIHEMNTVPYWISVTVTAPETASCADLNEILSVAIGRLSDAKKGLKNGKA